MAQTPDFEETARDWLIRAAGHARPEHVARLGQELQKLYTRPSTSTTWRTTCVEQAWDSAGAVLGGLTGTADASRRRGMRDTQP